MKTPLKEAKFRIKQLRKKYSGDDLKEMFMCTTSGYDDEEYEKLLNPPKSKTYLQKKKECYFCGDKKILGHHIVYEPEILIYLCKSCHQKIHFIIKTSKELRIAK